MCEFKILRTPILKNTCEQLLLNFWELKALEKQKMIKSSFRSQDNYIFVLAFRSCRKT